MQVAGSRSFDLRSFGSPPRGTHLGASHGVPDGPSRETNCTRPVAVGVRGMLISLAISKAPDGEWAVKAHLAVGFSLLSWLQS